MMNQNIYYNANPNIQQPFYQPQIPTTFNSFPQPSPVVSVQERPKININSHGLGIEITEEYAHQEESIKYTNYQIQGFSPKGEFATVKGYLDFVNVRSRLVFHWPSCKIPVLPDKTLFFNQEEANLQARRFGLGLFLQKTVCIPYLFYSADFQAFLGTGPSPGNLQVAFLKTLNPFLIYTNSANPVDEQITIKIVKVYEKLDFLTTHKQYIIKGVDKKGEFQVDRRYNDFALIREILVDKWKNIPIPHLPSVLSKGSEEREQGLNVFLQSVSKIPFLYHSLEWQIFIRYTNPDLAGKLKPFKKSSGLTKALKTMF